MGDKLTTKRATKVAAGGFPVAVGCHRAIELTIQLTTEASRKPAPG